ncbi:NAD-dependent DNA ligase LigA [Alkalihalophilus pseudofirmus]|uniref:NAD-dependent DNA ligase LigA n=1 Tax=Alkalihalophilus pseudofirmus TaxID=79885 RepID=UPI00259BC83C|nr:NAD-dependent DNA ligase LigA [Alkalihalophilus pseudofirmus]WEG18629.1 NAD-dependent DNA ligase LigA [Alkalihalophilus pseudofirmus]
MERMHKLIKVLNEANDAYYNSNNLLLSDREYDLMYDELLQLEKESGVTLSNSPTQRVGYEVKSKLNKTEHPKPLLSLDKTKDINELKAFIGNQECIISLKIDGLTTKTDYKNGKLTLGSTRGNGLIGEVITHNVKTFKNVPTHINNDISVVGESVITFSDFQAINSTLADEDKYKSARNLASGSVRQLDSEICSKRNVKFLAFGLLESAHEFKTRSEQLEFLQSRGFELAPYLLVNKDNVDDAVALLRDKAIKDDIPIDGLVCTYNDIKHAEALGYTSKHPKYSLAFKFEDDEYETEFIGVEANTTRTGMISLTGLFKPVDIDGVTVTRASLHNVDLFEGLQLGVGDTITVRRANMVIPQIMSNLTRSNTIDVPETCPSCGHKAEIKVAKEARFLYCSNEQCVSLVGRRLEHYVSRDALNIQGFSEATINKFIEQGFIKTIDDIYSLSKHEKDIVKLDGFGKRSYNKLIQAIESSKKVKFGSFIYALGIPHVGKSTGKTLAKEYTLETLPSAEKRSLMQLDDIGQVVAESIVRWFSVDTNVNLYKKLMEVGLEFVESALVSEDSSIAGKTFVVTGSVGVFKNRKELQARIEELGGKVSGSVSAKTDYLICDMDNRTSTKFKKAEKLNIPIITEDIFLSIIEGEVSE